MKPLFGALALATALVLTGCGPEASRPDATLARSKVIPPGPTGPIHASVGVVQASDLRTVTLDHDGAEGSGLAAGRTTFRTWGDVVATSPGEPGARVAFRFQKLGDGWAVVEMTGR